MQKCVDRFCFVVDCKVKCPQNGGSWESDTILRTTLRRSSDKMSDKTDKIRTKFFSFCPTLFGSAARFVGVSDKTDKIFLLLACEKKIIIYYIRVRAHARIYKIFKNFVRFVRNVAKAA